MPFTFQKLSINFNIKVLCLNYKLVSECYNTDHTIPLCTAHRHMWLGMQNGHVSIMSFHTIKLSKKQGLDTKNKFNLLVGSDLDIFQLFGFFLFLFFPTAEVAVASVIVEAVDRENHISVW